MTKRIIALDPGGTTGWAQATWMSEPPPSGHVILTSGQLGPSEHHSDLYALLELACTDDFMIVCESFEYRLHDRRDRPKVVLLPLEYIGVAKLFAQERKVNIVLQKAGLAKPFVQDETLKKMDLWSWKYRHAMDAYRHLLYFIVKASLVDNEFIRRGWK